MGPAFLFHGPPAPARGCPIVCDMTSAKKRVLPLVAALAIVAVYAANFYAAMGPTLLQGANDFAALYTGARQAGSGRLYDTEPQYEEQKKQFGSYMPAVTFTRLPFYASLLKPLSRLDYPVAWRVFLTLNILCALWFFAKWLWPDHPRVFLLGASFLPAYAALANGQDVWLVAALFGLAMLLQQRGRDFAAGAVLSLCAIKPHLFVFVPLVVAMQKRWRLFAGAATGVALLLGISFLAEGSGWVAQYLHTLGDPRIHPRLEVMPTLRNLVATAGGPPWVYWALCVATAAAVACIAFRSARLATGMAAALAGGLAVSYHSYLPDLVLLLPAFALLRARQIRGLPLWLWVFLLSPLPWLLWVAGPPWSALYSLAIVIAVAGLLLPEPGAAQPDESQPGAAA
jgi:hypothetical protein